MESSFQTTGVQPKKNPQHGRQPEARQKGRAGRGVGCGKTGKTTKEQKEIQQTEKGEETERDSQNRSRR